MIGVVSIAIKEDEAIVDASIAVNDDEDVALLIRRENVNPLVCINVEEIGQETLEMKHKQHESSYNLHHVTPHHEFHYTHKRNIQVSTMDEFERYGGNQHIPKHEETETQFHYIPELVSNRYDEQFAYVQRLVPPPCTFYSINSGEVAPRPVTMHLEVGELFPSKKQLES
ncbi:hypothetical protein Ddye_030150 [Dipteronia dyeriana]|uniref:Uncharacterized protein n=1 Tax=Dipteronia dyeriana TaxID=168575 RepID=A0AAD9WMG8_9ROSI|nr:hypothetical protein Ddye_030150 [Dipteronia dyeriana]